jgi:threonine/homoserine/homoserine lactone efflux protein
VEKWKLFEGEMKMYSSMLCATYSPSQSVTIRTLLKILGLSFSGSLPIGIMNMAALQVSLDQGVAEAYGFSCSAIGIEGMIMVLTGLMAIKLQENPKWIRAIDFSTIGLLILLGIFFSYKGLIQHTIAIQSAPQQIAQTMPGWQYGITLRFLNPTAIIFWLGVHLALSQGDQKEEQYRLVQFAVGGMIGTMCAYSVYILSAHSLETYLRPLSSKINLLLALLCFLGVIWRIREQKRKSISRA